MQRRTRFLTWLSASVMAWTAAVMAVVAGPAVRAQVVEADLALEIEGPSGFTPPGTVGSLRVTVTNLGPGNAGEPPFLSRDVIVASDVLVDESSLLPEVGISRRLSGDCIFESHVLDVVPGVDPRIGYDIRFDEVAAGESKSCVIEFFVTPLADGTVTILWELFATTVNDSNEENDRVSVEFLTQAEIPTLSQIGVYLLIALTGFAGFWCLRPR